MSAISVETVKYSEDEIRTLDWKQHIRLRPGMYIGKLGDGSSGDDGIYILLKEVLDNSIDEFMMGNGRQIDITIANGEVAVRDHGRGIPLGKLVDVSSKMNTGAKYDSKAFKKSVGLNGVGIKAVNALSKTFNIKSYRDGEVKAVDYECGEIITDYAIEKTAETNGVYTVFIPDEELFGKYHYISEYVETLLRNYTFLNAGLVITLNGQRFMSKNGLRDLLDEYMSSPALYPVIHIKDEDIEMAMTHGNHYGEEYYSFVNGQHTTQGGTHLLAFREAVVKTIREFYGKSFEASDIRSAICAAISIKVEEPVFESQTKTKLGSRDIGPNGPSVVKFITDFLKKHLDDYLHKNADTAELLLQRIQDSERERKAMSGIKKLAKDRAKKANLHNKKLRDCRAHYNTNHERKLETSIFITEGDSASGSITTSRD